MILEDKVREALVVPEDKGQQILFEWRYNGGEHLFYFEHKHFDKVAMKVAADWIVNYLIDNFDYKRK